MRSTLKLSECYLSNDLLDNRPRRSFLRAMSLPIGASLVTACGGGGAADAATPDVPQSSTEKGLGNLNIETADRGPSPALPPVASGPLPAWVANLPLWQWYEIPGTALSSVDPVPRPAGGTGPRSKIDAWCGAALKREGSVYLIGAAGGHADYVGNEVNALALNTEQPAWTELRGPSAAADVINEAAYYLDHRAAATHTYYTTQFIESLGRLVIFGRQGISGNNFKPAPSEWPYLGGTWIKSFDVARNDWDAPELLGQIPGDESGGGSTVANLVVKHPTTQDVYYSRNGTPGWYRWSAARQTWTQLSNATRSPWYCGAAIDPKRERMLIVGGWGQAAPEVRDLRGSVLRVDFGELGAAAITDQSNTYPGAVYDDALDQFIVVRNVGDRIAVHRVDAETFAVTDPGMWGTAPAKRLNGIQNAVQYVPELRGVVVATQHTGNVYFVRTAA